MVDIGSFADSLQSIGTTCQGKGLASSRHPVNELRVRYWYQGIAHALACKSAYEVEKRIEPEHFRKHHKRTIYPAKWPRYARGDVVPQTALIRKVEAIVPGSELELSHLLWTILKHPVNQKLPLRAWLAQLDPEIQIMVLKPQSRRVGAPKYLVPFTNRLTQQLLRRGDLDALSVLVIYWWEAKEKGIADKIEEIATVIYRMLLIVGALFRQRNLHPLLLIVFTDAIFDQTPWLHGRFGVDEETFSLLLRVFHRNHQGDEILLDPWRTEVSQIANYMSGATGFDLKFATDPFLLPVWELGPPMREQWINWTVRCHDWAWGWHCIFTKKTGVMPPTLSISVYQKRDKNPVRAGEAWFEIRKHFPKHDRAVSVLRDYGEWPIPGLTYARPVNKSE